MPKPEWGSKRLCLGCGAKFYDMMRKPIVCPKCEAVFEPESKPRKTRAPRAEVVAAPVAAVAVAKSDDEAEAVAEVEGVADVEDDDDDDEAAAALLADDDDDEDDLDDVGIGGPAKEDDDES